MSNTYRVPDGVIDAIVDIGTPAEQAFRQHSGLSVEALSEATWIPTDRILDIESGATPTPEEITALSDVLDVPADLLIDE